MSPLLETRAEVVTAFTLQGGWLKLIQGRLQQGRPVSLLGLKARRIAGGAGEEPEAAQAMRELAGKLPVAPADLIALLPSSEIFTRYLSLPSDDPEELRAMALYQLEGILPFPLQDAVAAVKVLGPAGEASRVLAAAARRSSVEKLIRIAREAGMRLTGIGCSSEAVGQWHRLCWPAAAGKPPEVWLAVELSAAGVDFGIGVHGSLVYLRQVPIPPAGWDALADQIRQTLRAYEKEKVGPPVDWVTLSGSAGRLNPALLEQAEAAVGLPFRRVDPLESSPFRESLAVTAQEFAPEVSFSELLGVVCAPRLLELDLLPSEIRQRLQRENLLKHLRRTALLAFAGLVLFAAWAGARVGGVWWRSEQAQAQIQQAAPQAQKVKEMAKAIRAVQEARSLYALQMNALGSAAAALGSGMTLDFLGMDGRGGILVLRGTAADFDRLSAYWRQLQDQGLWEEISLRSAKERPGSGGSSAGVEFELHLVLKMPPSAQERAGRGRAADR